MALATTMDVAAWQRARSYLEAPRKWRGKGAPARRNNNQRYSKNIHKVVKEQGQGLKPFTLGGLRKKRRFKRRAVPRTVPRAPYNDSSFLMRVRKARGLESSSFMSAPEDSSCKLDTGSEDFVNHEDYGYGSMTGLICLRPREEDDGRSSGTVDNNSNVDLSSGLPADFIEQLEQRLDRFEMTHPSPRELDHVLKELRVTRHDCHIKHLEDENLALTDRLSVTQQEINELRQKLLQGGQHGNVDVSDESDDNSLSSCLGRL